MKNFLDAVFHLVERPDARHPLPHLAPRQARSAQDESGNVYYEGGTDSEGRTRRWVIYNGYAEASAIPPGWHGWMHHRVDVAAVRAKTTSRATGRSRIEPNLTGSAAAYRPKGSVLTGKHRPQVTGDYDAWTPG